MAKYQAGETFQKTFLVSSDEIKRFSCPVTMPTAVKDTHVAPNALVTLYLEAVLSQMTDLPMPGRVLEQQIRFANPVYGDESIEVKIAISYWNPDAKLMRVGVQVNKADKNLPVCVGNILLSLK